jgi:hypothetical protein
VFPPPSPIRKCPVVVARLWADKDDDDTAQSGRKVKPQRTICDHLSYPWYYIENKKIIIEPYSSL